MWQIHSDIIMIKVALIELFRMLIGAKYENTEANFSINKTTQLLNKRIFIRPTDTHICDMVNINFSPI